MIFTAYLLYEEVMSVILFRHIQIFWKILKIKF